MSIQLGFWEAPPPSDDPKTLFDDALRGFAWSYSRRSVFEQCVRRYYYEYFGANKRTAKQDPDKEILHLLKRIPNRHERAGQILHLVIGTYLRKCQEGDVWKINRLAKWAQDMIQRDIEYSQSDPSGENPPIGRFPPVLLHEFYYQPQDALGQYRETEERLINAITSFATDEKYAEFRVAGATTGSLVEKLFKVRDVLPFCIEGKVDLAYRTGSKVTVVDWKLGLEDGTGDDSLQLATYALWATNHFQCSPDSARICKVHFGSGTVVDFSVNQEVLADAKARILQDAERMLALDHHGRQSVVRAFTPCIQPKVCVACSFLKACPEGKEKLND